MFCIRCGSEVNTDEAFCWNCGAPLKNDDTAVAVNKKKRGSLWILVALIFVVVLIAVVCTVLVVRSGREKKLDEQLKLAERYLSELNYEGAIACYKKALEIDPDNTELLGEIEDAYMAWAEETDDPEEADEILEEAEDYFAGLAEDARNDDISAEARRIEKKIRLEREKKSAVAAAPAEDEEEEREDTPVEERGEMRVIDPGDLPESRAMEGLLEAFTLFGDIEYDHEKAMYTGYGPDVLPDVVFDYGRKSACYPMNVTEIWDESEKDPKGLYLMFAYISRADLQWVYRNVYNCSEEDTRRLLDMENKYGYEYDGVIYYAIGGVGGPQSLMIDEVRYDGVDYVVDYHIEYPYSEWDEQLYENDCYRAVIRYKMYGSTGYWSIYSNLSVPAGAADGNGQDSSAYKEAYGSFLKDIDGRCAHSLIYTEIYLDADDTPELVVANPQNALAWSDGYIFTYKNNEVTFLGSVGYTTYGCFDYYEYGGLAYGDYVHTGTYGKTYILNFQKDYNQRGDA